MSASVGRFVDYAHCEGQGLGGGTSYRLLFNVFQSSTVSRVRMGEWNGEEERGHGHHPLITDLLRW